jgi:hypothetical protein
MTLRTCVVAPLILHHWHARSGVPASIPLIAFRSRSFPNPSLRRFDVSLRGPADEHRRCTWVSAIAPSTTTRSPSPSTLPLPLRPPEVPSWCWRQRTVSKRRRRPHTSVRPSYWCRLQSAPPPLPPDLGGRCHFISSRRPVSRRHLLKLTQPLLLFSSVTSTARIK